MNNFGHPILSICIPTYNHIDSLKICLDCVLEASKNYENNVEILISDNCSNDGTKEYISQLTIPNLRYYRNEKNLGFNKNLFLLVDNYATGEFVWTIGDDDYISKDTVSFFFANYKNCELILLKYLITNNSDLKIQLNKKRDFSFFNENFYESIDRIADYGNLFATFMTCAIFKRNKVASLDKSLIQENNWENYQNVFPNGYLLSVAFSDSRNVYSSKDSFIYIIPYNKDWDDRIVKIQKKILPDFYNYLIKNKRNKRYLKKSRYLLVAQIVYLLRSKQITLINAIKLISTIGVINYVRESKRIKNS